MTNLSRAASAESGSLCGSPKRALAELFRMKEEGLADAVGLAAGRVDIMLPLLKDWDFDALITHNRFTLVYRNAGEMMDYAQTKGIAVLKAKDNAPISADGKTPVAGEIAF